MSDGRDGFLLRDPINKEKISLKKETQLFPKEKSKYWWLAFHSRKLEGQGISLSIPLPLSLVYTSFPSLPDGDAGGGSMLFPVDTLRSPQCHTVAQNKST